MAENSSGGASLLTEYDTIRGALDQHARTHLTAAWKGSPDPGDPRNIRRVCSCGQLIGQLPYPAAKPGVVSSFRLGGEDFDQPHREHTAQMLAAPPEQD